MCSLVGFSRSEVAEYVTPEPISVNETRRVMVSMKNPQNNSDTNNTDNKQQQHKQ